jgi:hypothetical protein
LAKGAYACIRRFATLDDIRMFVGVSALLGRAKQCSWMGPTAARRPSRAAIIRRIVIMGIQSAEHDRSSRFEVRVAWS